MTNHALNDTKWAEKREKKNAWKGLQVGDAKLFTIGQCETNFLEYIFVCDGINSVADYNSSRGRKMMSVCATFWTFHDGITLKG